jgi:MFS family permease
VIGFALFGSLKYLPLFQQTVRGLSPTDSGLQLVPLMLGLLAASITSGQVISRTGRYKAFPIAGTAIAAVGLYLLAQLEPDTGTVEAGLYMLILGVGLGLVMQVLVLAVQNAVPYSQLGVATSAATLFRSIGGSLGTAILGAIFANRLADEVATGTDQVHAFTESLHTVFLIAACVVAVAFLLTWFLPERPLRRTIETAEGVGEAFAAPNIGDSVRELSRQLAVAAGRERSRAFIERLAARAGVDLNPLECWLIGRVADGSVRDPHALAVRANVADVDLTGALQHLREAGLVTSGAERAALTEAGNETLGKLRVAWATELRELVADWHTDDDDELTPLISRLADEFARDPEPATA